MAALLNNPDRIFGRVIVVRDLFSALPDITMRTVSITRPGRRVPAASRCAFLSTTVKSDLLSLSRLILPRLLKRFRARSSGARPKRPASSAASVAGAASGARAPRASLFRRPTTLARLLACAAAQHRKNWSIRSMSGNNAGLVFSGC